MKRKVILWAIFSFIQILGILMLFGIYLTRFQSFSTEMIFLYVLVYSIQLGACLAIVLKEIDRS